MPQKTIIVGMLCLTMLLTVWAIRLPEGQSKVAPLHANHKENLKPAV